MTASGATVSLPYNPLTTASENVAIPFGASHPEGFATYAFRLTRGTANVPLSQPGGFVLAP